MSAGPRRLFGFVSLIASVLVSCALALTAHAQGDRGAPPGDFDYYVLALSWSPTYCDQRGGEGGGGDRYDRGGGGGDRYDRGGGGGDRYDREGGGGDRYDRGGGYRFRFYDRGGYEDRYGGWGGYNRRRGDSDEQCSSARPYAFVLHGLWPQYDRRGWPEWCEGEQRPWVSDEVIDSMMDIMPSRKLVIQEYKKHGVCSGLDPRKYFSTARDAYRSIRIPEEFQDLTKSLSASPDEIRRAFLDANKQLSDDMVQVVCSRRLLREVRVCFSKDLTPQPCSQREQKRKLCNYDTVIMPPVRGGGTGPRGGPTQEQGERQQGERQQGERQQGEPM